ncbi:hypothetical protein [Agrobacterium tumefaciens]|uniref:hypothetical protein n=1 Tax=Agrobacterium tumefaciens TaxID=358 RepID=UPI0021D321C1|nr:hypothetical protein [Agrobacterium tumefaciens]UXS01176.1 hypothetical protein FY156_06565 [Agrobacterium tumefaciens]
MKDLQAATDRLFRDYGRHCQAPNEDTLFHFLNSLHSFSDKLKRHRKDGLHDSPNFIGLKALRNLFHHEAELLSKISVVTDFVQPVVVELSRVCLVDRSLIERAAAGEAAQAKKFKRTPGDVVGAFRWYGQIVDIEPAVFNVAVDAYEAIKEVDVAPWSDAFQMFEESYEYENENGFEHRVTGTISCHGGNVAELLSRMHETTATRPIR